MYSSSTFQDTSTLTELTNYLTYLEEKIIMHEDKLVDLKSKKDFISKNIDKLMNKSENLVKPLEDIMNSEDFEDVQEKYMNSRMKRITFNKNLQNSDSLNKLEKENLESVNYSKSNSLK